MQWVSLIGILLSVFGASYAAVSALRGHWGSRISEWCREVKVHEKVTKNADKDDANIEGLVNHCRKFDYHHTCWVVAHGLPVALFSVSIFTVCVCFCSAILRGTADSPVFSLTAGAPGSTTVTGIANFFGWLLLFFLLMNLCCFITACFAHFNLRSAKKETALHHRAWQEKSGSGENIEPE